jgi:dTDP-4-dehydrorhamnose reductase
MRVLILGASGLIGHKLWQTLVDCFDCYAVLHRAREHFAWTRLYDSDCVIDAIDLTDFTRLNGLLSDLRPDVVLNAVGVTKRHLDETAPLKAILANAALPHALADWARRHGKRVFQFSTDCVFSGASGGYTEECEPDGTDIYGRSKALGELHGPGCLTLRTSFIGRELSARTELLEWFLAKQGQTIKGFTNAIYTGVSTHFLSQVVIQLIEAYPELNGLYQLAAPPITKFYLLCLARDAYGVQVEIQPEAGVVIDRSLNGRRFTEVTGIQVPSWEEMMYELAAEDQLYQSMPAASSVV